MRIMAFSLPLTRSVLLVFLLHLSAVSMAFAEQINPYPRGILKYEQAAYWGFNSGTDGCISQHNTILSTAVGALVIEATGLDPYLLGPAIRVSGPARVVFNARAKGEGPGSIFWTTKDSPNPSESKVTHFNIQYDGQWHEYSVDINTPDLITRLRLDPGSDKGVVEINWMRIDRIIKHPLEISEVRFDGKVLTTVVKNWGPDVVRFSLSTIEYWLPEGESVSAQRFIAGQSLFESERITLDVLKPLGIPPLTRTVNLYHPDAPFDSVSLQAGDIKLEVVRNGSGARILRDNNVVAILSPLLVRDGQQLDLRVETQGAAIVCRGFGVGTLTLRIENGEVIFEREASAELEGPVVRVLGGLEQGLLAGVEYLGKGERSSSKLDLAGPEHLRYEPDTALLTMPLMAFVTDRASVAMRWEDMTLKPSFATPNFYEGTPDHRMSLKGSKVKGVLRIGGGYADGGRLEDAILWAVKAAGGLPDVPKAPRDEKAQFALCLEALNGPLHNAQGWGHCVNEEKWKRQFFGDQASTIWRLSGVMPQVPELKTGGAHIPNYAGWFVTGRAEELVTVLRADAERAAADQKPDGSFTYDGEFRKGHFENTASGWCARGAWRLLTYASLTGDKKMLEKGLKTLEYIKRFRTPRGAQVWEMPLHTPDILASAYLVRAYLLGYELTERKDYLTEARRWAITGVPFVYQWGNQPIMRYATTAVLGATNWRAPVWIGRPVQWCGLDYAYAVLKLSAYDTTLDWRKMAEGILIAGEQMQYTEGDFVGTLPDSLLLDTQEPQPWNINPCALVSIRLLLAGQLDSIATQTINGQRIASPFPIEERSGKAVIKATKGATYQVLINGQRIVEVQSKGEDLVEVK